MSIDAMKQALEALDDVLQLSAEHSEVRAALRAAIEQAQEPVAWVGPSWLHPDTRTWESQSFAAKPIKGWIPLYTAPRQWQGLTEIEFRMLYVNTPDYKTLWEAIEAKLRNKNQ